MITNEQIHTILKGISEPTEGNVREVIQALLTESELVDYLPNGIFNPNTNLYEGVIVYEGIGAPIIHFTYDWDTDEYISLIGN